MRASETCNTSWLDKIILACDAFMEPILQNHMLKFTSKNETLKECYIHAVAFDKVILNVKTWLWFCYHMLSF